MKTAANHFVLNMRYLLSKEDFHGHAENMANLDERYQEAFSFLIKTGYGIQYAFNNCANWYEAVSFSSAPLSYMDLYLMNKRGIAANMAGIKLKELLTQELN